MPRADGLADPLEQSGRAWCRWACFAHDPRCRGRRPVEEIADGFRAHDASIIGPEATSVQGVPGSIRPLPGPSPAPAAGLVGRLGRRRGPSVHHAVACLLAPTTSPMTATPVGGAQASRPSESRRDVEMLPIVEQALRSQHSAKPTGPWVFANRDGGSLDITNLRERVWRPAIGRARVRAPPGWVARSSDTPIPRWSTAAITSSFPTCAGATAHTRPAGSLLRGSERGVDGYCRHQEGCGISRNPLDSWSGRPDSNRRRPAWEAGILPLNYGRPAPPILLRQSLLRTDEH